MLCVDVQELIGVYFLSKTFLVVVGVIVVAVDGVVVEVIVDVVVVVVVVVQVIVDVVVVIIVVVVQVIVDGVVVEAIVDGVVAVAVTWVRFQALPQVRVGLRRIIFDSSFEENNNLSTLLFFVLCLFFVGFRRGFLKEDLSRFTLAQHV